ncbi:hypothetical protein [Brevundimonas sp. PAMC22021]|uniref:hypothetical protein n=1 Tax=Brevundimonas sp. PAMC22021 TaxID=2861285 RepID=UPI0021039687|nr:hypothetical protein [Brevundimonas sp. PAMC22021]
MKRWIPSLLFGLALAAMPPVGSAQEPEASPAAAQDWDLVRSEDADLTVAAVTFDSGVTLATRCMAGVFDVLLMNLPPSEPRATSRQLGFAIGEDGDLTERVWSLGSQTTAISRAPAPLARELAKGGRLQIALPAAAGARRTRYVMDLDPSSAAVEQTLTACGRPLVDPRDLRIDGDGENGLPLGLSWDRPPRPAFPGPVKGRSPTSGYATLTCAAHADGKLDDCQIEAEHPAGFNLGRSALNAMPRARVKVSDEAGAAGYNPDGRLILFVVNFAMR